MSDDEKPSSGSGERERVTDGIESALEIVNGVPSEYWSDPPSAIHPPASEIGRAVAAQLERDRPKRESSTPPALRRFRHWKPVVIGVATVVSAVVAGLAQGMSWGQIGVAAWKAIALLIGGAEQ